MLVDKLLMTTSIQFMRTKHSWANKNSPRISSYNWQPEEFSLIIKLFIVFAITLFLNLPQVLFVNAFALSLIPSLPIPLVQKPAKSKPLAHDRRSITLVQIPGPPQNQQHLLVVSEGPQSPIASIHMWRKGSTAETCTKSWSGQRRKSMANSL